MGSSTEQPGQQQQLRGSSGRSSSSGAAATLKNQHAFHQASATIAGTAEGLKRTLKQLDAELKEDVKGQKEFNEYLTRLQLQRADLQARIAKNKAWIDNCEASKDGANAFETQYRRLLADIQQIYEHAKEGVARCESGAA